MNDYCVVLKDPQRSTYEIAEDIIADILDIVDLLRRLSPPEDGAVATRLDRALDDVYQSLWILRGCYQAAQAASKPR